MGIARNFKFQILNFKFIRGFTFIEMLVVVGVTAFILPVLFAIIFVILQQQTKVVRISEVKRQGDYTLNIMENIIRSFAETANSAVPPSAANQVCSTYANSYSGASLYFKDKYNQWFGFISSSNKISSASSNLATVDLTNSKVIVSNFSIGCYLAANYSTPIVTLTFDICYNVAGACTSARQEETATFHYETNIKLRNY